MQKGFETVNLHGTASGVIAVPVIGENGNWWIGNQDTGIFAKGKQGEIGLQGPKGDKGEPGPIGPQGLKGEDADRGDIERLDKAVADINTDIKAVNSYNVITSSKFKSYIQLVKLGEFYILDVLISADSGFAIGDVICTLPITAKASLGRYLAGSNGKALQCGIVENQLITQNANSEAGDYGGLIIIASK